MQLPTSTPLTAAVVAGALAIGGLVAGAALVGADSDPSPLAAASPASSSDDSSRSTTSTTVRGSDDVADDLSGPCDEAEHAADPRCAATGAPAPAPAPSPAAEPTGEVRSFAAADAGVVVYRVDGASFTLLGATPADGWAVEIEQGTGDEIDLDFRRGTVRVQVDVEWEDGGVRERVRVRDDATDERSETETTVGPAGAPSTPTTVDDHGGDVDRDDRVEAGDDRSGTDDDGDDRSGSGHGDDDADGSASDD